jgi:tetratricopeptide (TPR) repeat protein
MSLDVAKLITFGAAKLATRTTMRCAHVLREGSRDLSRMAVGALRPAPRHEVRSEAVEESEPEVEAEVHPEAEPAPEPESDLGQARARLAAKERMLGPRHPAVAAELHLIGALLHDAGQYEEAVAHYDLALTIREHTFAPDHPEIASTLEDLAITRLAMGDDQEASFLKAKAHAIRARHALKSSAI